MHNNKNKFWSLIFGAILANSYVWLVDIGANAPVPEVLQTHTLFVLDYYSPLVTALLSALLAGTLSMVMLKVLNICVTEHILWMFWPSLGFAVFTAVTASALIIPILQAVIPALFILSVIYVARKRQQFSLIKA